MVAVATSATISASPYGRGTDFTNAKYGTMVSAGAHWAPAYASASRASAEIGFGGNVALSCSGIDFKGFLHQFNPSELLTQMKDTLVSGAQAAVSSYLITLAYANPTLASVLDMLDKKYTARFDAFAQACNAKEARKRGEEIGARRMAEAEDQCFSAEIQGGASPTEAYRICANASTFGKMDLPALKRTGDFLKRYTSLNLTAEMNTLLNMLSDEEITSDGMRMRPPTISTSQVYGNLESRAQSAIKSILGGADPSSIPECREGDLSGESKAEAGCIPATAANLVNSPTFLSARVLSPSAVELYTSAMSSQVAMTALYSNIYELKQQVSQMDAKAGSGVGAEEVTRRRDGLLKQIDSVERQADALRKIQDSRVKLAKTQIITLQKAQEELVNRSNEARERKQEGGMNRLLRMVM